jgi:hypothetical protein
MDSIGRAEAALRAKYREKENELAENRKSGEELLLSMP